MNAGAASASSKGAKLWRRTWVGSLITGGLALVVYLTTLFRSELPVLAVSLAVLGVCIYEVHTMGKLSGRKLAWPLAAGALAVGWLTHEFFHQAAGGLELEAGPERRDLGYGVLWLPAASWWGLLTITVAYALVRSGSFVVRLAALVLAALPFFAERWLSADQAQFALGFGFLFLALRLVVFGAERRGEALGVLLLGTLLVVSILGLTWVWYGFTHWGLVALIAICKLGDSAGYYVGSTLGRHHPFKKISPGKTSEGCLASLAAAALGGAGSVALGWLPGDWPSGLAAGAAVSVAAQASDLLESWVKRKAGVKDSGTWFGPSGGMLDLVDSFFLATPVALAVWPLVLR